MRTGVSCVTRPSGETSGIINYIPLRRSSDDWYLTMSGEAREVWEQTGNNNWGQQPYWNGFFLERYSAAVIGFTTGDCQNTRKPTRLRELWVGLGVGKMAR